MGNEAIINDGGLQNAQRVATLELTHLTTVTLLRLQEKQCFLKVLSFSDNFLMEQNLRRLKIRVSKFSDCAHILNVYKVRKQQRNQLCTNNYQLHIYLQYFDQTLAQSIQKHLVERRNYTQHDLYSVLGKAVDSLIYIQDNGLKTIHLDADAIVFSGDQLKILDGGVAFSKEYYHLLNEKQKNIRHQQHNIYLAPQLLKQLKELNYDPYVSPKADIFSLGMILLQMITLQPMNCYYDYHKATIDYESLIHRLSRISHSLPLKTLLAEMLQQDPEIRIGLVSLKEKLQKVNNPSLGQQSIIRSRSSKMLKQILSNSRKSSVNKQEASAPRHPSKERKIHQQYASNSSRNKQLSKYSVNDSEKDIRASDMKQQIKSKAQQYDFKNIVKNKLNKDRNKENPNLQLNPKIAIKSLKESSRQICARPLREANQKNKLFDSTRSNNYDSSGINHLEHNTQFQSNIDYNKFEASRQSKDYDNSISVKNSLCKLVQQSSLKNLLNLQKINPSISNNYHSQRVSESTSRFPSFDISDQVKRNDMTMSIDLNLNSFFGKQPKTSQIYVKQQKYQILTKNPCLQDMQILNQESIGIKKPFNKGMTFNNKQFGLIARSVQASVEDFEQYSAKRQQKLIFSPIQSTERQQPIIGYNQGGSSQALDGPEYITVRSIPVIVSQEKVCMTRANSIKNNLGKIQRKLETSKHVQLSPKIRTLDYSSKINNPSTVVQTDNVNQLARKPAQKSGQNCAFFKKIKNKQALINIEQQERQKLNIVQYDGKHSEVNQAYYNGPSSQMQPDLKSLLDVMSKTSRSIQQQEQTKNISIMSPLQNQNKKYSHSTPNILVSDITQNTYQAVTQGHINQIVLQNGDIYQGEINSYGQMHGNGIIYSQGKIRFNGYFKNNKFNGSGTLYNLTYLSLPVDYHFVDLSRSYWISYEGDFQNGFKNGFGKIYFANGDRLAGSIKKDMIEGWACFYPKNGQPVSGWWIQNRFQAPGV